MGQNNIDPKYIEDMIIPTIIKDKEYIVRVTSNNVAYSEIGFIQRISIADKSDLQDEEVYRFNNDYKRYINKTIDGLTVKELIKKIKEYDEEQYKNNTKKYIRILFDLSEEYTNNN
ncbi:MAG: hypothetical protein K6D97_07475 [Clostridia bacterium]|nr:hypothetical protein [Clostridia bacterium]